MGRVCIPEERFLFNRKELTLLRLRKQIVFSGISLH